MNEKLFSKIATAYYGNERAIDPAIIALIISLIQSLIAGCPVARVKLMMAFPILSGARRRIRSHVEIYQMQSGERMDVSKVCSCIEALGVSATIEEIQEVKGLDN